MKQEVVKVWKSSKMNLLKTKKWERVNSLTRSTTWPGNTRCVCVCVGGGGGGGG